VVVYVEQRAFKKRLMRARAAAHGPRRFMARAACTLYTLVPRPRGATTKLSATSRSVCASVGARDSTPSKGPGASQGGEQRIRSFCIPSHAPGVPPADSHASPTARRSRCCSTVGAQLTSRRGSNTCRAGDDATQQKLSVEIAEDSFSW